MTEDEMYENIRAQMRGTDVKPLEALYNTLKKAGTETKSFTKGENHLYVRCNGLPWQSLAIIQFLADSNVLEVNVVAMPLNAELMGSPKKKYAPYLHIFTKY